MKHKIVVNERSVGRFTWEFPDEMNLIVETMQRNAKKSPFDESAVTRVFLAQFERLLISYLRLLAGAVITNHGQKDEKLATEASKRITRFYKSLSVSNKRKFTSLISDFNRRNGR